jgi:transposase, IS30 family
MVSMNKKNNKGGTHLKLSDRREIKILIDRGYSIREISSAMNRGKSSISDEIKNNSVNGVYDPDKAHAKARHRRRMSKYQGMKIVGDKELRKYVEDALYDDWSPEIISGRIKKVDKHIKYASHRVIYKYISSVYGRQIEYYRNKRRQRRRGSKPRVTELPDRTFIDDRPSGANNRSRFGHFEGDFIVSNKTGSGSLIVGEDRKARFTRVRKMADRKIDTVHRVLPEMLGGLSVRTLTLDNDVSFARHEEMSELLGSKVYFCHPYSSWEKGSVERVNRMIREYIPKGSDISKYSDEFVQWVEDKINDRPRACLGFKSPREVMIENGLLSSDSKGRVSINSIKSYLPVCPV